MNDEDFTFFRNTEKLLLVPANTHRHCRKPPLPVLAVPIDPRNTCWVYQSNHGSSATKENLRSFRSFRNSEPIKILLLKN